MLLCLVRHGETEWVKQKRLQGRTDIALNDNGKIQAELVYKSISNIEWNKVISSPLIRAKQSSKIISNGLGLGDTVQYDIGLLERDFGSAEGTLSAERSLPISDGNYVGLEAFTDLQKRIKNTILSQVQQNKDQNLIFVFHSSAIRAFLTDMFDIPKFTSQSACISLCELNDNEKILHFYNYSADQAHKWILQYQKGESL